MPLRIFKALWYPADGSAALDVTNKLMKPGTISRGVSDPNKLLAYIAGDVSLEFLNGSGWANSQFGDALQTDLKKFPQVDLFRLDPISGTTFTRIFRGFVEGNNASFSQRQRRLSVTALGPRRLLDQLDAENKIRRTFPAMMTTTLAPEGQNYLTITPVSPGNNLVIGDEISITIAGDDPNNPATVTYKIQGVTEDKLYLTEELLDAISAGAVVTCVTPWYKNVSLVWLAQTIFETAGVPTHDVRFTGSILDSTVPFVSTFNTTGLIGLGAVRGVQQVDAEVGAGNALDVTFNPGDASLNNHAQASNQDSGFSLVVNGNLLSNDDEYCGGLIDRVDHNLDAPDSPMSANLAQKSIMDYVLVRGSSQRSLTHPCTRSAVAALGGRLFQLLYKETVKSLDQNGGLDIDSESGGGAYTLELVKLKPFAVPGHAVWAVDTSFYVPSQITTIVPTGGTGVARYTYLVETVYNFDGRSSGRCSSAQLQTTTGVATLSGSQYNLLTIKRRANAVSYNIWRVATSGASGNGATIGLIANRVDSGMTGSGFIHTDTGAAAAAGTPYAGHLLISSGDNAAVSGGESGLEYQLSIEAVEGTNSHTLFAACWMGGGSLSANNRLYKITLDSGDSDALQTWDGVSAYYSSFVLIAMSCGGVRAVGAGIGSNITDVYLIDTNLGNVQHRLHRATDGASATLGGSLSALYPGTMVPILKTMKWNRDATTGGARMSMWYYNRVGAEPKALYCGFFSINRTTTSLDFRLEETALVTSAFRSPGFVTARPAPYDLSPVYCNWWKLTIGGASIVWVHVAHIPSTGEWVAVSSKWLGFIDEANMEGLDATGALEEYGIPVNARFEVDWTAGGVPYGRLLSRDLIPAVGAVTKDFTKNGKNNEQVLDVESLGAYANQFSGVEVTGRGDIVESDTVFRNPDGTPDVRDRRQMLSIKSRAINTRSFAKTIAKAYTDFFGPRNPSTGAALSPKGAHQLTALDDWRTVYIPQSKVILIDEEGASQTCWIQNIEEDQVRGRLVLKVVEQ